MEEFSSEAEKKAWEDVEKLKTQIQSLIISLQREQSLMKVEKPLISLLSKNTRTKISGKSKENIPSSNKRSKLSKSFEDDEEDMDIDINYDEQIKAAAARSKKKYSIFKPLDLESFLLPIFDNWIYGITVINASESHQILPEILFNLNDAQNIKNTCRSFVYEYQILQLQTDNDCLLNLKENFMDQNGALYSPGIGDSKEIFHLIPPGSKILITVKFSYPFEIYKTEKEQTKFILSLLRKGKQLWSKIISISPMDMLTGFNDKVFKKYQPYIFSTFGQFKDFFKLEISSLSNERIGFEKYLESFLNYIKFENISGVNKGLGQNMEVYSSNDRNGYFWGLLIKFAKTDIGQHLNCEISARSRDQMNLLKKIFMDQLRENNSKNESIIIIKKLLPSDNKDLDTALRNEIDIIFKLVYMTFKGLIGKSSETEAFDNDSEVDVNTKWLNSYINAANRSDSIFMQFMSK